MTDQDLSPEDLSLISASAESARREREAARKQLSRAEEAVGFWDAFEAHVGSGQWASAQVLVARSHGLALEQVIPGPLRDLVEARARDAAASFGREFPRLVRTAGVEIENTSRHPRYDFKNGFIHVEVDD